MTGERYRAFISYSHQDAKIARWLHRRLETYRFPRRLTGQPGSFGTVPARLGPIFRDREEFAAATSLSEAVRRAIEVSEALIVVCSPAAAASLWVAREIEAFRESHPESPLLLALVDGEPTDAFPGPALAEHNEPLAADFRKQGDGRRLGLLKLLAGLAGVPLGELVQRDAQRRLRRVTAVTVAALVGLLALTALSVVAIRARHEAEQRRTAAEGLVEFMQTDLRERLKAVNRLDVLTAANRRALAYYSAQDLANLRPGELARRSQILHDMGEDDLDREDYANASGAFIEARRTTGALLARAPKDPDIIFAHAQSEYWIGDLAWRRDDLTAADAGFQRYAQLAERLLAVAPSDVRSLREIGYATGNLCTLRQKQKRLSGLIELCLKSLRAMERAAVLAPNERQSQLDVANRHAWVADAYRKLLHDLPAAGRHRVAESAILQRLLAAEPDDAQLQRKRIWSERATAALEREMGAVEAGTVRLRQAIQDLEKLVAGDPANRGLAATLDEMRLELRRVPSRAGETR
ncbi:toll/interleukin-1 receptor domain-containing protein [Sphingomonas sp. Root241]|uniref:toll/interleukin-1 receptor domain-containing protein n=1 Tax=Sphingomonas sp. Root241 TaxID=1736501 RepID=UPI0006FA05F0|nr:toll/interleukin-1 receptor domain-containing protein [Sphingomonas sp. Root241]KRC78150.1 hypothetical protein ASE13_17565 [Sphingomonas sp. Root241]